MPEQFQDVFTTLCVYSGISAFYITPYDRIHKTRYALSLVKLGGKWCVFDAYYGVYFKNKTGDIASFDDIVRDSSIVSGKKADSPQGQVINYGDFIYNLSEASKPTSTRPERQMPFPRLVYEARKMFRMDTESKIGVSHEQ